MQYSRMMKRDPRPMTGEELQACRKLIGWTRPQLARQWDCGESTIRAMESDAFKVWDDLAEWIRGMAEHHEKNPPRRGGSTRK